MLHAAFFFAVERLRPRDFAVEAKMCISYRRSVYMHETNLFAQTGICSW